MAEEISNKTLVGLLVVAIIISLAGTWISLTKINQLGFLTGMTLQGTGTLDITPKAYINVSDTVIDFKDGYVNTSAVNKYADLWSNGSFIDWINASAYVEDYMVIDNIGNVDLEVNVSSNVSNTGTDSFICQGQAADKCGVKHDPDFGFWTVNSTTNPGCEGTLSGSSSSPTRFAADDTDYVACDNLVYGTNNSIKLYLYTRVPTDAVGKKYALLTFTGTA